MRCSVSSSAFPRRQAEASTRLLEKKAVAISLEVIIASVFSRTKRGWKKTKRKRVYANGVPKSGKTARFWVPLLRLLEMLASVFHFDSVFLVPPAHPPDRKQGNVPWPKLGSTCALSPSAGASIGARGTRAKSCPRVCLCPALGQLISLGHVDCRGSDAGCIDLRQSGIERKSLIFKPPWVSVGFANINRSPS